MQRCSIDRGADDHQRGTRLGLVAALMLMVGTSGSAGAQTLELGGMRAPELGTQTLAASIAETLRGEIDERDALAARTERIMQQQVLHASANYRRIAAALLERADRDHDDAAAAYVMGLTLAEAREALDDVLRELAAREQGEHGAPQDGALVAAAAAAVRVFNERASASGEQFERAGPNPVDAIVSAQIMPLGEAVALIEPSRIHSHWPAVSGGAEGGDRSGVQGVVHGLRPQLAESALSPEARTSATESIEFLEFGLQLIELRPQVRQYARLLAEALSFTTYLQRADWLRDDDRGELKAWAEGSIIRFRTKTQRPQAMHEMDRMSELLPALGALVDLGAAPGRPADMRPLRSALLALQDRVRAADDPGAAQSQLRALSWIARTMLAFRSRDPLELRGDLRIAAMKLERQYEDAEAALLSELDLLIDDPDALANPAFNSVLNRHRQYLEDLQRIRRLPQWVSAIEALDADAASGFRQQTHKMAAWLIEPARRQHAVRAMEHFDVQWSRFRALPLEEELRAHDAPTDALLGGRSGDLLARIGEERRRWAEAWSAGDAGSEAARRLSLIDRLLRMVRDFAAAGAGPGVLNRWSAWEVDADRMARLAAAPANRLAPAVESFLTGNDADVARHLQMIERETRVQRLIGRIAFTFGDSLARLPADVTGAIGQVSVEPEHDAILLAQRLDIAELCRALAEGPFARRSSRDSLAGECDRYADHLAERLLRAIGPADVPVPVVVGFDGSDPAGEG